MIIMHEKLEDGRFNFFGVLGTYFVLLGLDLYGVGLAMWLGPSTCFSLDIRQEMVGVGSFGRA